MTTGFFTATWVSGEDAGATSAGPNSVNFIMEGDSGAIETAALAFADAIDPGVSGDLMSVTREVERHTASELVPDAGYFADDLIIESDFSSEHARFLSCSSSVRSRLTARYASGGTNPGTLGLFASEQAVIGFRGVSH